MIPYAVASGATEHFVGARNKNNKNINVVIKLNHIQGFMRGTEVKSNYDHLKETVEPGVFTKWQEVDVEIYVSFQPKQGKHLFSTTDKILEHLKAAGGKSGFNDKSSPEDIKNEFRVSKKMFKQAIGRLYKQGKIKITDKGIELVK